MDQQLSLFGFEEEPVPASKKTKEIAQEPAANDRDPAQQPVASPLLPEEKASAEEKQEGEEKDNTPEKENTSITVQLPSDAPVPIVPEEETKPEESAGTGNITVILPEEKPEPEAPVTIEPPVEEADEPLPPKRKSKRGRKSFREIDAEVDLIEVPDDEQLYSRQYYSISQVARWFRVNNSLLRYWENEFDILKPRKNRKGDRLFRPEDVKNLQVIYYLLRQKKYTIDGARKYLKTNRKTADTHLHIIQALTGFKKFLLELKANAEK